MNDTPKWAVTAMGGIIGDIAGSRYEHRNFTGTFSKSRTVPILTDECTFTDDTVLTVAVMKSIIEFDKKRDVADMARYRTLVKDNMLDFGRRYENRDYGDKFQHWLDSNDPQPYQSIGNGCLMRVAPCGWMHDDIAKMMAQITTMVTHDSLMSFYATTSMIEEMRAGPITMSAHEYESLAELRNRGYDVTAQGTWYTAKNILFQSRTFEDLIRNSIFVGGDVDTNACIAGSIFCRKYPIPMKLYLDARTFLPDEFIKIIDEFDETYVNFHCLEEDVKVKEELRPNRCAYCGRSIDYSYEQTYLNTSPFINKTPVICKTCKDKGYGSDYDVKGNTNE